MTVTQNDAGLWEVVDHHGTLMPVHYDDIVSGRRKLGGK
jgi:hypothetical protein